MPGQVQPEPGPFIPATQSPNIGGVMSRAGERISAIGDRSSQFVIKRQQELQERKDKAAAKDAFVAFGDQVRGIKTDLQSRKKRDAVGTTAEAQRLTDEALENIAGGLENDKQRELFNSLAFTRRGSFLDGQALYEKAELEAWETESSNAMALEAIEYAAENYDQPNVIDDAKTKIDIAVTTGMKGSSAEAVKVAKEIKISAMHKAVIYRMAVNSATEAKEYYDKYKEEIDGTVRAGIEEMLKKVGVKQKSQAIADEIVASGASFEDQLDAARKLTADPEVRDAVVERIKIRHDESKKIEKEDRQEVLDNTTAQILDLYKSGGSYEQAIDIALSVDNGSDQFALKGVAKALYLREDTLTSPDKFVEAMARIDNKAHKKGPIKSIEQLFREYKPYLSNSDFDQLMNYWQSGGSVGELKDSRVKTIYKNLTGRDPDESKTNARAYKSVWDHVISNLSEGKKPTDEEIKKLVVQATIDGERQFGGIGYGEDMGYLEAKRKGYDKTWLPDVTAEEKESITKELKEANNPVSDFTIRLISGFLFWIFH